MNKKGFTLIEVIMVIAIIAILSLILIPNVMILIDKNKKRTCEKMIDNIESAAKMYVNQNKYELGFDCSGTPKEITLKTLVDAGYLGGELVNPINKEEISLESKVLVTYDCSVKGFKYKVDGKNVVLDYSKKEKDIAIWLEKTVGGKIYMLPRINKPDGIMTADYLFRNEYWDLKSITGCGKRIIEDTIKRKKRQSKNFIFDITNSNIQENDLLRQLEKVYNSETTKWVNKIIVKKNENVIIILKRKD